MKLISATLLALAMPAVCGCAHSAPQESRDTGSTQRTAGKSYPNMPSIAPIGEKIGKYMDVPASAVGPAVDPALASTQVGVGLNPLDKGNPWAVFDDYIDRVAAQCVSTMTPKWSAKLAAFDVYIGISAMRWSRACESTD